MTTISERGYQDNDLPLLQQTLAEWISRGGKCGYCHTGDIAHRAYNGVRGRVPLDQYIRICEQSGTVLAFMQCNPYYNGFDAYVAPELRGSDLERDVLLRAYDITRAGMDAIGRAEKAVLTDVDDGDDLRRDLLLQAGFAGAAGAGYMVTQRSLHLPIPEPMLLEGFSIRQARMEDYEQLAAVHSSAFNSNWTAEQYRDQIMQKPGYTPEYEWVIVAPDGQFAAFTVTWLDQHNRVGLFEPVGVHADFQRKGFGRAIMLRALHWMQAQGMAHAEVVHEADNPASGGLYASIGFERMFTVTSFSKS